MAGSQPKEVRDPNVKTVRKIFRILKNYHPEYGDDWLSTTRIRKMLKEEEASTKYKYVWGGLKFLREIRPDLVEQSEKEDLPFEDSYTVWRVKGKPEDIDLEL